MRNAPLTNGTTLTIAIGCALFLFGLSIGLVIAGICWAFIAASGDHQASSSQESYASISDDEIEIVIELVRDAIARCGWALCGDCYTHNLLQRLQLPVKECIPAEREKPVLRVPASTRWVDDGAHSAQNTPDSLPNGHHRRLRVEQGASLGRVPTPTS